jgi:2-alkenal reductase
VRAPARFRGVRALAVAAVAFAAAVCGAAVALAVGKETGWIESTKTVAVSLPSSPTPSPASVEDQPSPLPKTFDAEKIYARRSSGVVTIFSFFGSASGQGSGFVVSPKGYILTNAHVITTAPDEPVERAENVYVEFADGDRIAARIVGFDLFSDVGLIKVDPASHSIRPLPLGSSASVVVGEPVAAIGSPFGNENSLSVGVVSGTRRSISSVTSEYQLVDAIQTDAAINHGNSGGPLLDGRGRVIGINAQIRSSSGAGEGVGFAVPIDTARRSMDQLLGHGRVRYAYVGITTDDVTPALAHRFHFSAAFGALITCVKKDSPGATAGLHGGTHESIFEGGQVTTGGDVIVAIDGHPVRSGSDVVRLVGQRLQPGRTAMFTVLRGSARHKVAVVLGERPSTATPGCQG